MNTTVTFTVPVSFQLPTFYTNASPERTAFALRIGAQAIGYFYNTIADEVREECNAEVVTQLEKKHTRRSEQLEREKRIVEENLDHLKAKMKVDEQYQVGIRQQVQEEMQSLYKTLLEEKDRQIHRLESQVSLEMRTLQEKFQTVKDSVSRNFGSQEKGKAGEGTMEDLIKKAFGSAQGFDLQTTATEAQRGDYLMAYKASKVMWEVKNYTRMVNKDEVEKLHRDMRSNPEIAVAFMVSLQSGIVGHTKAGDIDLERLEDGRFILYLDNLFKREDPLLYLQSLRPFLDILDGKKESNTMLESEEIAKLEFKMKIVQHVLLNHQKTLAQLHNSLFQQKKKTDQMNAELLAYIKQAEAECVNSLRELLGEQKHSVDEITSYLSPETFTKQSLLDCSETQKKFLTWLKENCEKDEGAELESKKFQEAYKKQFKSEKEQKEIRELFTDSVWPKGGKKVRGFRFLEA